MNLTHDLHCTDCSPLSHTGFLLASSVSTALRLLLTVSSHTHIPTTTYGPSVSTLGQAVDITNGTGSKTDSPEALTFEGRDSTNLVTRTLRGSGGHNLRFVLEVGENMSLRR